MRAVASSSSIKTKTKKPSSLFGKNKQQIRKLLTSSEGLVVAFPDRRSWLKRTQRLPTVCFNFLSSSKQCTTERKGLDDSTAGHLCETKHLFSPVRIFPFKSLCAIFSNMFLAELSFFAKDVSGNLETRFDFT